MATLTPTPRYWPSLGGKCEPEVEQSVRLLFNAVNDHENAIINLKAQMTTAPATSTSTNTSETIAVAEPASTSTASITLGGVNNQTGTSYQLVPTDNGGIVTLANAGAVALALNSTLASGYFGSVENIGPGTATLTPTNGDVNGSASLTLVASQGCFLYFDGLNWWAMTSPAPTTPTGLSVTITTAALGPMGSEGSMTFTNGLLTAQTPATDGPP
jgi:hypothetical protein